MPKNIFVFFIFLCAIYLTGMGIDIMDIDAAQYASISRDMLDRNEFLQVYDAGNEYLDKPPFLFWVSAISMKIFGPNNFGYRLPSLLFALLSIYATYRLAGLFYQRKIAVLSALVLASSQGFFLMTHDVRTDTILMSCVIISTWQWMSWMKSGRAVHFLAGCIGIACGMMTKGPIALLVPGFALGTQLLLTRDFKNIFRWQYIPALFLIALMLVPMSWGLYHQFDVHPEKIVNGKTGVSGLRFFYWTQSFGRITGESPWNNNKNLGFLMQNMLWSFLPWIMFFIAGLIIQSTRIIQQGLRINENQEALSIGGFTLSYIALGLSNYQLPHYIFVAFPFASIIAARFIIELYEDGKFPGLIKAFTYFHAAILFLLGIALVLILWYPFPQIPTYAPALAAAGLIYWIYWYAKNKKLNYAIPVSCLVVFMGINLFVNLFFYPALLEYQAGSSAGRWMRSQNIPAKDTRLYQYHIWRSLHFYANGIVNREDDPAQIRKGSYVITSEDRIPDFTGMGHSVQVLYKGADYPVSRLTGSFLNPATREKKIGYFVIIRVN